MRKNDTLVHTRILDDDSIQLFNCFFMADLNERGDGHNDDGDDADDKDDDHAIDMSDDDDTAETDYDGDDDECQIKMLMSQPC